MPTSIEQQHINTNQMNIYYLLLVSLLKLELDLLMQAILMVILAKIRVVFLFKLMVMLLKIKCMCGRRILRIRRLPNRRIRCRCLLFLILLALLLFCCLLLRFFLLSKKLMSIKCRFCQFSLRQPTKTSKTTHKKPKISW